MRTKWMMGFTLMFLVVLSGCGSNGGSGGSDVPAGGTTPKVVGSSSCKVCHTDVAGTQQFNGSVHDDDTAAGCEGCHGGGQFHRGLGPIPYPEPGPDQCQQCHTLSAIGHTDNPATGTTAAGTTIEGYVVKTAEEDGCQSCHYSDHDVVLSINEEWANSAHGGYLATGPATDATAPAWTHYNWDKTSDTVAGDRTGRADCQRCHTATGISNFLTNPAGYDKNANNFSYLSGWTAASGSPQQEVLYCWGCHSDVSEATVANPLLRNPGAIVETYAAATTGAPPTTVSYPDIGPSNVCMGCHIGREVGDNIVNDTDADGVRSFINSHYLTAGGTVFNKSGYEYGADSSRYSNFGFHKYVGVQANPANINTGTTGPCVTCHMSEGSGHTFNFVEKEDGIITANSSPICTNCHASMSPEALETAKENFHVALEELQLALEAKGLFFGNSYPYFFKSAGPYTSANAFTDWAGPYGVAAWRDVMGAAFNFNLFEHDPGAYAHNSDYALQLIADSIDFLADGAIDGDGSYAATLIGQGMNLAGGAGYSEVHDNPVTAALAAPTTAAAELECNICHSAAPHFGPVATAQFMGESMVCANCHAGNNIAANPAELASYADSGHADVTGAWSHEEAGGCSRCHTASGYVSNLLTTTNYNYPNAEDANRLQVLACSACHDPATLAAGDRRTAAAFNGSWTANSVTVTHLYPDSADSNLCVRCHSNRQVGDNLKNPALVFTNLSEIRPHYLGAAGTVFAYNGYAYSDNGAVDYPDPNRSYAIPAGDTHVLIGQGTTGNVAVDTYTNGPCVTCHFTSNDGSHTLSPLSKYAPGDVSLNPVCVNCHATRGAGSNAETNWLGTDEIAATLQGTTHKARYQAALEALRIQLALKGFNYYNGRHYIIPIVTPATDAVSANQVKNWVNQGNAGAAFNYNLLIHEPGGVAHNRRYTRRLIYDSIDWLDNGALDYSVSATLNALGVATVYKSSAISYLIDATAASGTERF